jgi:hypothetical protein
MIIQFAMLFLNDYGNSSISSTSPFKFMVFSYLHEDVIDIVGTTIIIVSMRGSLIKTHVEFIKNCALRVFLYVCIKNIF